MNIAVRDVTSAQCTRTQHIELRLATVDDAPVIARLIGAWFPMTTWKDCLTYDEAKAATFIERGIATRCEPFVLAFGPQNFSDPSLDRNVFQALVGCISWHLDARLTTEPVGVLDEVFVVPRLRRSDLGRRLVMMALHIAKEEGARVMNFPIASGMPEQQSLINMLVRHFGAEPVGVILRKVL